MAREKAIFFLQSFEVVFEPEGRPDFLLLKAKRGGGKMVEIEVEPIFDDQDNFNGLVIFDRRVPGFGFAIEPPGLQLRGISVKAEEPVHLRSQ